jgi:hypothetical protein
MFEQSAPLVRYSSPAELQREMERARILTICVFRLPFDWQPQLIRPFPR